MKVLGNAIITKMYRSHPLYLKLNYLGLFYKDDQYEHLVTTDVAKIATFIGFDFTTLDAVRHDDIFYKMVVDNKYFKAYKFKDDASKGESRHLRGIAEYLRTEPFSEKYERLSKADAMAFFEEEGLDVLYEMASECHKNKKTKKVNAIFNGKMIIRHIPDYDTNILNETISAFKKSFGSKLFYEHFILTSTEDEIIEKFLAQ